MAIVNVNSISGINSITAQSTALNFYDSAGGTLSIGASVSGNITGNVTGNVNATGLSTFSGGVVVAAGTTAAPSISPTGDSNTGIFFPSADTVAIGEGGVEALRIDSSGNIGIGTANPLSKVHIQGTGNGSSGSTGLSDSSAASALLLKPTIGSGTALSLGTRDTGGHYIQGLYAASSVASVRDVQINPYGGSVGIGTFADAFGGVPGSSTFVVATTGIERLRIDTSGRVTMPYQPCFQASGNQNTTYTAQVVPFNVSLTNNGSNYSTTTYRFTAPVAGHYFFTLHAIMGPDGSNSAALHIRKNGTIVATAHRNTATSTLTWEQGACSAVVYLNASDYTDCYIASGTIYLGENITGSSVYSAFNGFLLG